jgi:hypothetical protein
MMMMSVSCVAKELAEIIVALGRTKTVHNMLTTHHRAPNSSISTVMLPLAER